MGFPDWFTYSPTYSASGSMTFTRASAQAEKFMISGNACTVVIQRVGGTTGGTASNYIKVTLPVTPAYYGVGSGAWIYDNGTYLSGTAYQESGSDQPLRIYKYDQSNWSLGANRYVGFQLVYGI